MTLDHITRHQLEHAIAVAAERWAETVADQTDWHPTCDDEVRLFEAVDILRYNRNTRETGDR